MRSSGTGSCMMSAMACVGGNRNSQLRCARETAGLSQARRSIIVVGQASVLGGCLLQ